MKTNTAPSLDTQMDIYDTFAVRRYEVKGEKKSDWLRVGVAFPHKDDRGFNVFLQATPISGELVILRREPRGPGEAGDRS